MSKTLSEKRFINHEFKEAAAGLRRMAKNGNPRGIYCLGQMLIHEFMFTENVKQREEGLRILADGLIAGDPLCLIAYARYDVGLHGNELTSGKRAKLAAKAQEMVKDDNTLPSVIKMAEGGDVLAMMELGMAYGFGILVKPDRDMALSWLEKAADAGYWAAMLQAAGILMRQQDTEIRKKAFNYVKKAAEMGDSLALVRLGDCYHFGLGCEKSFEQARRCYDMACRREDSILAVYSMSRLYDDKQFPQASEIQTTIWTEKAAQLGSVDAMCVMGDRAYYGRGVPKDMKAAENWYKQAVKTRNGRGYFAMGRFKIYTAKIKDGIKYMEKAAQAGWPEGYYILGLMKMQGIGMKVDRRRGRVLLEQAASAGVVDAKDVLNSREKVNLLEALRRI
ncbi:MAG: hypothetical protein DBY44_07700 [Veillonellaceae bacterium]|nr:MAG: hypothetical protein DBY44_07700 [Veillonellaceae bacterium]